jgi:hypothetical protein
MHAAIHFVVYWLLAFWTLGLALVLLNIYSGMIGKDLALRSLNSEAAIAVVASLVEAVALWLILTYAPGALRAMIAPALIVAFIYRFTHVEEDWDRFDVIMLLFFQVILGFVGLSIYFAQLQTAMYILLGFGSFLAVLGFFARGLWD